MRQLGISVYPHQASLAKNKEYIKLAADYGFKRIFTCLLSIEGKQEEIVNEFKEIISFANSCGMEVIADVSPRIFGELNISYKDLSFFNELDSYGIRLDMGFTGNEESLMTFNPYDLKVEINMSNDTHYIDTIMDYKPNVDNILGCHNFYPHRHSGLRREHFRSCTANFKKYGITTAAFVNSQQGGFGPWPVVDGLCTLEDHRNLAIDVQAKDLFLEGIDVVIIANAFASEAELRELSKLNKALLELNVELHPEIPEIEEKIVLEELHFNRGDINPNMIRSTQSRVKYKGHNFKVFNTPDIKRGDIIIESSLYGHYAGELQIALNDMPNSGKTNVVGRVVEKDLLFLDRIEAWQKFRFKSFQG